jgi:hypothetical protein
VGAYRISPQAGGAEEELIDDLERGDVMEFKIKAFVLNMNIYKCYSSSAKTYVYPNHG